LVRAASTSKLAGLVFGLCLRAVLAAIPAAAFLAIRAGPSWPATLRELLLWALVVGTPGFLVGAIMLHESGAAAARRSAAALPMMMGAALLIGGSL
jgi:hypothetical protein